MNTKFETALNVFVQLAQFWVAALGLLWMLVNPVIGLVYIMATVLSHLGNAFARAFVLTVATIDLAYLLFLLGQLIVTWVLAHIKTIVFILVLLLVGGFALWKVMRYYREEHARISTLKACYQGRVVRYKALMSPSR